MNQPMPPSMGDMRDDQYQDPYQYAQEEVYEGQPVENPVLANAEADYWDR